MASSKKGKDEKGKSEDIEEVEYPEGYESVRDIVKPYRDDIWRLNERINKLDDQRRTQPGRPVLSFNPPGMNYGQLPKIPDRELLVRQRDDLQQQLDKHVGVITKDLEPTEKQSIKEAVRDDVDRNPFLGKSKEELEKFKNESKDLSLSQNFNMMQLKNYRKELEGEIEAKPVDKREVNPEPKAQPASASDRFAKNLNYTKTVENVKDITEKAPSAPQKSLGKDER